MQWRPLKKGGSVKIAQLGYVHLGTIAVDLDLRQLRLDPLELLVGHVDVSSAGVLLEPPESSPDSLFAGRTPPASMND